MAVVVGLVYRGLRLDVVAVVGAANLHVMKPEFIIERIDVRRRWLYFFFFFFPATKSECQGEPNEDSYAHALCPLRRKFPSSLAGETEVSPVIWVWQHLRLENTLRGCVVV